MSATIYVSQESPVHPITQVHISDWLHIQLTHPNEQKGVSHVNPIHWLAHKQVLGLLQAH